MTCEINKLMALLCLFAGLASAVAYAPIASEYARAYAEHQSQVAQAELFSGQIYQEALTLYKSFRDAVG